MKIFLTSVLDGGWSASSFGRLNIGTRYTGGWVGLKAGLDTLVAYRTIPVSTENLSFHGGEYEE
jgi:hypothetical protein